MNDLTDQSARSIGSRAFTLIELAVVIVVLCLLTSTLLPVLAKSRPTSLALQCLNNQRQLCAAWRMYADDNLDRLVYASDEGDTSNPLSQYAWAGNGIDMPHADAFWWNITFDVIKRPLWPYGKTPSIYKCPADYSFVLDSRTGVLRPRVRSLSMNLYLGGFVGTYGGLGAPTSN